MKRLCRMGPVLLCVLLFWGVCALAMTQELALVASAADADFDCSTATDLPLSECDALVALYETTGGDYWTSHDDWLVTTTVCLWEGVTCESGHVTELWLGGHNLSGALPAELHNLSELTDLYLYGNNLTALPPGLGNFRSLEILDLSANQLTALPSDIGHMPALEQLFLYANQLSDLPSEIALVDTLERIDLGGNLFTDLPPEVYGLPNLWGIQVGDNIEVLTPRLGDLTSLRWLHLSGNKLITVPNEIGNLTSLTWLALSNNRLISLPLEIGNLTNMYLLFLEGNRLSKLPATIGQLTRTTRLQVSQNQLTSLPPGIGGMQHLATLWTHDNPLSGELPGFLTSLESLSEFTYFNTRWCVPETGSVRDWLDTIPTVYASGLVCDVPGNRISGVVTDLDTAPAPGIQVGLYRSIIYGLWQQLEAVKTATDGTYAFTDLGQGTGIEYRVHYLDPRGHYPAEYYDNQASIWWATPITLAVGISQTNVNARLGSPKPPTVIVDTETGSVTGNPQDGTVIINVPSRRVSDITLTRTITCAMGNPTDVHLTLTPPGTNYPMTAGEDDAFSVEIPAEGITEDANLSIYATCGVTTSEIPVGEINLYDPSGFVTDARSGAPVQGATVTLFQVPGWMPKTGPEDDRPDTCESNLSKEAGTPWSQPAPTDRGIVVNTDLVVVDPALPYQTTTVDGSYGWDVGTGCWYVQVAASGYLTLTSPVVGVPPEVTDLDLALTPVKTRDAYVYLPLVVRNP